MHTETKNTDKILDYLAEIIETLNEFNNNTDLESFYIKLSERLFEIVAVLKSDLYGKKDESKISMKRMENVLKLKIKAATKYEMLEYFLSELYRQIREKGYLIDGENDFKHQARQFYDGNGYCHLGIELEEGTWLSLDITRKEGFFYGVGKGDCVWSAEEKLRIEKVFLIVNANKEWFFRCFYGNLKFNEYNSSKFDELKNPRKRESFVTKLVEEIVEYVERFKNYNNNLLLVR